MCLEVCASVCICVTRKKKRAKRERERARDKKCTSLFSGSLSFSFFLYFCRIINITPELQLKTPGAIFLPNDRTRRRLVETNGRRRRRRRVTALMACVTEQHLRRSSCLDGGMQGKRLALLFLCLRRLFSLFSRTTC